MESVELTIGDRVVIDGVQHRIDRGIGPGAFVVTRVPWMCVACDDNDVDGQGDICPGCYARAFTLYAVRDAVNHLVENDDMIVAVIDKVNNDNADARRRGIPHINLEAQIAEFIRAHYTDQFGAFDEEQVRDAIEMYVPPIARVLASRDM